MTRSFYAVKTLEKLTPSLPFLKVAVAHYVALLNAGQFIQAVVLAILLHRLVLEMEVTSRDAETFEQDDNHENSDEYEIAVLGALDLLQLQSVGTRHVN